MDNIQICDSYMISLDFDGLKLSLSLEIVYSPLH
jgi:hypothetical protein